MINECTEYELATALNNLIAKNRNVITEEEDFSDLDDFSEFRASKESFNLIKVQLRALALICLSDKKKNRSTKDNHTYWTLTPYGDYIMTQLLAIKK